MTAGPIADPRVKLPLAVRAQAARAERLQKESTEGPPQEGQQPPQEGQQPPQAGSEPAAQPPQPGPEHAPAPDQQLPQEQQPPQEQPAPQEQPPQQQDPQPLQPGSWEQRYFSMEGRFRAEQRRNQALEQDVDALLEQVTSLQSQLAQVQSQPPQQGSQRDMHFQAGGLVTPQMREEYGDEFIQVVENVAKEATAPLLEEIARLKGQVAPIQQSVQTWNLNSMKQYLADNKVPYKELNRHQPFLDWLQQPDRYSGQRRHDLLRSAWDKNDAPRVAAFFQDFLKESGQAPPAQQPVQTAPQPPARVPLESLAAPGRANSVAPSAGPAEKPPITDKDIKDFYDDVVKGRWARDPAGKARREAEINEAVSRGRVAHHR